MEYRGGEVLPDWKIKELIEKGVIIGADPALVNPSSLDLRLGHEKWKVMGSFFPLGEQSIRDLVKSPSIVDDSNDEVKDFFVDANQPYLVKLVETLNLPDSITAKTHNKSGRGRIGVSLKGLVNKFSGFDSIPAGYKGEMFAEVCATAFPVVFAPGKTSAPQIRFYNGIPQPLRGIDLDLLLKEYPILTDSEGNPSYTDKERAEIVQTGRLTFHADLSQDIMIYKAKRGKRTIVLSKKDAYDPKNFFEPVMNSPSMGRVVDIHPDDFVLIKSQEHIRLPPTIAAEIFEYSEGLGDLRTHYAGLINAGHGWDPKNPNVPSYIVFEVRARDIPVILQDGQRIAKFELYRMMGTPKNMYMDNRSTDYSDLKSILPTQFKK